ncbi:hypothetical protein TNCV_3168191 [Trichonephila clavipes]|nr:hypothetical protein TNCV_3168191 [Trichonephila clavipes]
MLIEEWALLPQEMLHQLVLSMRRRCEATIAAITSNTLPRWYPKLVALGELARSDHPGSYAGGSLTTGRVTQAGQVLVGSCSFLFTMNPSLPIVDTASPVTQVIKGRDRGLGRGRRLTNELRSPTGSLKIL